MAALAALIFALVYVVLWFLSPSQIPIRTRAACSLAPFLAPMNPEVFGVLLYSFWWVTLYALPILFWTSPRWAIRIPVLVLVALSSLAGSLLFFVFGYRWLRNRTTVDLVSAFILLSGSVIQLLVYLSSVRAAEASYSPVLVVAQAAKNVGAYYLGWLETAQPTYLVALGAVVLAAIAVAAVTQRSPQNGVFTDLALALIILTVVSSVPVPGLSHLYDAGPRYYFLPFSALSILFLVALMDRVPVIRSPERRRVLDAVLVTSLAMSLVTLAPGWSRDHARISWSDELALACTSSEQIRIHVAGQIEDVWVSPLSRETCLRWKLSPP